jgi:beta-lactamase superfamily II metal-dependent hydrolase
VFSVEMLPARQGDCLWIEYGDPRAPHVILVDGGMTETAEAIRQKVKKLSTNQRLKIELLVVTHIDNDHILGILELLGDPNLEADIGEVWFNGRPQLEAAFARKDVLGTAQGDDLSQLLEQRQFPWNEAFKGGLVVRHDGAPPQVTLGGGMRLTVVGPTHSRLAALADKWLDLKGGSDTSESDVLGDDDDILGRKDVWPPQWSPVKKLDDSVANGSSIALVAEFEDKRLLLSGDAFAPDLTAGLAAYRTHFIPQETGPISFAAVKLSHHGSAKNITRELIDAVHCERYLVSTDGTQHGHPDVQALLSLAKWCSGTPTLHFNYRSGHTDWWIERRRELEPEFQTYETAHPDIEQNGWLRFDL